LSSANTQFKMEDLRSIQQAQVQKGGSELPILLTGAMVGNHLREVIQSNLLTK
jgi:hypothetical protein